MFGPDYTGAPIVELSAGDLRKQSELADDGDRESDYQTDVLQEQRAATAPLSGATERRDAGDRAWCDAAEAAAADRQKARPATAGEEAAIAAFLAKRGATTCPAAEANGVAPPETAMPRDKLAGRGGTKAGRPRDLAPRTQSGHKSRSRHAVATATALTPTAQHRARLLQAAGMSPAEALQQVASAHAQGNLAELAQSGRITAPQARTALVLMAAVEAMEPPPPAAGNGWSTKSPIHTLIELGCRVQSSRQVCAQFNEDYWDQDEPDYAEDESWAAADYAERQDEPEDRKEELLNFARFIVSPQGNLFIAQKLVEREAGNTAWRLVLDCVTGAYVQRSDVKLLQNALDAAETLWFGTFVTKENLQRTKSPFIIGARANEADGLGAAQNAPAALPARI